MKNLIKGLHKFQTTIFPIKKNFFENLVKGQKPEVLFITCSDSRINPNLITTAEPGELFILRNAGYIIPAYGHGGSEEATIEFAIHELGVKDIILCGHSHCGAVQAAMNIEKIKKMPSLYNWISKNILPTLELVNKNYKDQDQKALSNILIQENVLSQIENLKTHPAIIEGIQKGLRLHAWVYQFESGKIFSYDSKEEQFKSLKIINEGL